MEPGTLLPRNNFSSIARRLLLGGDLRPVSQVPTTSYDVQPTTSVVHAHELNATDLIPCALLEPQQQVKLERHTCDLCDRLRGITAKMLKAPKAPVEKSCKSIKSRGSSNIGRKAKATINHVKGFFKLLRRELGRGSHETLFKSPTLLTALACGVSIRTVTRISKIPAPLDGRNGRALGEEDTLSKAAFEKFGQEWSAVVRHFVNTVLEEEGNVTVTDLHNRICYAYADFPMCSTTLFDFLRALDFSYRVKENMIFILAGSRSETESESESEHEDEDM
ncbi:hypothetical protein ANCCAN_13569 [Ancylostoma caninum]|uniref:Uncharacterized protein n=1 Tax=Ancylostoma caninum TaxID=29170 RepID=A0A368G7V4_ANCCA|nr:hypothetical protein ANCCAN_13569 [Ancylostoma caninum]